MVDIDETQNFDLNENQDSNEIHQPSDIISVKPCSHTNEATLSIQATANIQNSGDSTSAYQSALSQQSSDRDSNHRSAAVTQAHCSMTEISKCILPSIRFEKHLKIQVIEIWGSSAKAKNKKV